MRRAPGGVGALVQDDRAELRPGQCDGESGVPPHPLAALISGAYFSAPLVPIAFL